MTPNGLSCELMPCAPHASLLNLAGALMRAMGSNLDSCCLELVKGSHSSKRDSVENESSNAPDTVPVANSCEFVSIDGLQPTTEVRPRVKSGGDIVD